MSLPSVRIVRRLSTDPRRCPVCSGKGRDGRDQPCKACEGKGEVLRAIMVDPIEQLTELDHPARPFPRKK